MQTCLATEDKKINKIVKRKLNLYIFLIAYERLLLGCNNNNNNKPKLKRF
jgi:hypothetical protein